ncbi:hypothetical protein EO95_15280 [Methanosarcina sp. 1.H.T.1A.1]|uniref:DUF998 domain-containing protein n=1 Tax=Methanosarcina sp. 1.H.T.1A.1 TaxID=1483602 RepID=UPI0006217A1B|nr:DUF998 domain-containing protein [Methanosarcina sp. 1.H.T.1A.1]KKH93396.1 hypothetical protein EO95_15280 [Methanosarcina sp. 1.H.T.1A.1]
MKKIPLTSVGSFLAITISLVSALASSLLYNGSYSILNNWISDLGNSSRNPNGHIYFDVGCILTGIAIIILAVGLEKWKTTNRKQDNLILLSRYCGLLMAFALIMVGIFSEDYGRIHYFWASVYFILMLIFLITMNIALKNHPSYIKWIWYYTFISILIIFIFMFTVIIGLQIPILEWLAVLSGLIWIGLIGYNTLILEKPMI